MQDFPFAGQTYEHISHAVSAQRSINWIPEPSDSSKSKFALIGAPGIDAFVDVGSGPIHNIIPFDGSMFIVSGNEVYRAESDGTTALIGTFTEAADFRADAAASQGEILYVNGSKGYTYDTVGGLVQITDGDFPVCSRVSYQDEFFLVPEDNTNRWITSNLSDGTAWDALDASSAEQDSDSTLMPISDNQYVWVVGERSTEIWFNAANATGNPFSPQSGAYHAVGSQAKYSIAKGVTGQIFFLGNDDVVYMSDGLSLRPISHQGIVDEIQSLTTKSDAIGFCYKIRGMSIYTLTFPTEKRTFEYRIQTDMWHERESFGLGRWMANCAAEVFGDVYVGDFSSGKVGKLNMDTYKEWSLLLQAKRIGHHISASNRPIFMDMLEFQFDPGVGLASTTTDESDPVAQLEWSDDLGKTFRNTLTAPIGAQGKYETRTIFRQLGTYVNRTYRLTVSDPVKRNLVAAYWMGEVGDY